MNIPQTNSAALRILLLLLGGWACLASHAAASTQYVQQTEQGVVHEYFLVVERLERSLSGQPFPTLTINGTVPGPVLRFKQGEIARITVENFLDEPTSFHWHGLLLPNGMDGVAPLTGPLIPPGGSGTYEFPLRQAGTFWYHSHAGLQEQQGLYGAIVVEPLEPEPNPPDGELVLVLSDWVDAYPSEVMRTLMRGSEWYGIKKGTLPTLWGAWSAERERPGSWAAYWARERARLPAMDISDVAYDAFLINGQRRLTQAAEPGQRWRLRVINAAASSYFYVHSASGPLTIVAADGPAVEPIQVGKLLIGIGETYDLELTLPGPGSFEVRATAQDGSGQAALFLGQGAEQAAGDLERPDLYRMEAGLLAALLEARRGLEQDDQSALANEPARPLAPYARLRSRAPEVTWMAASTAPPDATQPKTRTPGAADASAEQVTAAPTDGVGPQPVRSMVLRLTGDMRRYVWSLNGKTLSASSVIPVERGERLRLELVNDTMMHHPMHLHGFFFRLIEGQGERSPLKHTVDVPPMGKRTIEFDANEVGDWLFHCHLLYHMEAGMTRVLRVREPGTPAMSSLPRFMGEHQVFLLDGLVTNYMTTGSAVLMGSRNEFSAQWDAGIEHSGEPQDPQEHVLDGELDFLWSHVFDPNFATQLGYRFSNEVGAENRAVAGVNYRLPYLVLARLQVDSEADLRLNLSKEFQLTRHWSLTTSGEYDTFREFEGQAQLEYLLSQRFSAVLGYQSRHGFGLGIAFRL